MSKTWTDLLHESAAAMRAADEARDAADDARDAVAAEEAARARRTEWERAVQESEAEREAERQRRREETAAHSADLELRREAMRLRCAAELVEIKSRECVRWEIAPETRERLRAGAEMVWGSVEGSKATAVLKVFKLIGMSADEVRVITSEVSQRSVLMWRSALGIISWDCASGVATPGGSTGVYIYDVVIIYHYRIAIAIASNRDI